MFENIHNKYSFFLCYFINTILDSNENTYKLEKSNPESGNVPTFNIFVSFKKCKLDLMKALAVLTLFPCLMVACIRVTPKSPHLKALTDHFGGGSRVVSFYPYS
jgi:hypothetical protein